MGHIKLEVDRFLTWLPRIGPDPYVQRRTIFGTDVHWLIGTPHVFNDDDSGSIVNECGEADSAALLNTTFDFLSRTENQLAEELGNYKVQERYVGRPELIAFVLPFVEANYLMTGKGVGATASGKARRVVLG